MMDLQNKNKNSILVELWIILNLMINSNLED